VTDKYIFTGLLEDEVPVDFVKKGMLDEISKEGSFSACFTCFAYSFFNRLRPE
jgi:hypothetical protein